MADQTINTGPTIHITNAEAGAATFAGSDSRSFNYFKPKGRQASVYEDVTVDVQPDPDRHLLQGWLLAFGDGTQGYDSHRSKMKSSDWHVFRDPNEEWHRNMYTREANTVRQIQQTLTIAREQNVYVSWDKSWIKCVETYVSAMMHLEYGLGMYIFMSAQRDSMTNMINSAISIQAADKLRLAQDLALYNLELSECIPNFNGAVHKQIWKNDPVWLGARENVERLTAISDWAEQVFATNLIYEPLCGELFRTQFVMQHAAPHGDFVTPVLFGIAEHDYERSLAYSIDLFKLLVNDEKYGAKNKQIMEEWLTYWTPFSIAGARLLQPIWSQTQIKVLRFEDAFERAKNRFKSILSKLELQLPEECMALGQTKDSKAKSRSFSAEFEFEQATPDSKAKGRPSSAEFEFKREPLNLCGVTMSASVEGNVIADVMSKKPGITITRYPAIIRIDAQKTLEFDMEEIGAALGYEPGKYTVYDFEVETSTHYGRQVRLDDKVLIFANPEDAAEYLGFEIISISRDREHI